MSYDSCCVNRGEPESADHPAGDDAATFWKQFAERSAETFSWQNEAEETALRILGEADKLVATIRTALAQAERQRDALKGLLQRCLGYVPSDLESAICEHL